jgi:hypothetical protein
MTMTMVTAKYSAITPSAVSMHPEKKATTIKNDAQPYTGTFPKNFP